MTPATLGFLILGIQIIFMVGTGTFGLVERQLLVISGFWLQTNQHLYASTSHQVIPQICCHMNSNNSVRL
jgi:hypothetical protein